MKRLLLAAVGTLAVAATSALAADMPPARPLPLPRTADLRAVLHLERLLCRHQRRLRLRQLAMDRHRHPGLDRQLRRSTAGWSAARSATTCSSAPSSSASRAISTGATSRARPRSTASAPARPTTPGSARRAGASAMPSTASCPISPPARAFGDVKGSVLGVGSFSQTKVGWTAGGGLEYAFIDNWTAKLEYLYVDLGKATCDAACSGGNPFTYVQDQHRARRRELQVLRRSAEQFAHPGRSGDPNPQPEH